MNVGKCEIEKMEEEAKKTLKMENRRSWVSGQWRNE